MKLNDRFVGVIGLIADIILYFSLDGLKFKARTLPQIILIIMALLCVVLIIRKGAQTYTVKGFKHVGLSMVLIALYLFILKKAGFIISTTAFLAGFLWLDKYPGKWITKILFVTVLPVVCYFLFAKGFGVKLPTLFL